MRWANKKIEKMHETDEYKQAMMDKILYKKSENCYKNKENLVSFDTQFPIVYKPKLNIGSMILFGSFIIFGLFFTYIFSIKEDSIIKYFPLLWTIYGIIMYWQFLTKKYVLNEDNLFVTFGSNQYTIPYGKIYEITKEKINMGYKHGLRGRKIRAETDSDVLFIKFFDDKEKKQIMMISPKEQNKFLVNILMKLNDEK
ncbi:hypothetical protein [Fusobacterium sp. PH5-29]